MTRDRGQISGPTIPIVPIAIVLVVIIVAGSVMNVATSPEMKEYVNKSAKWCDSHGGELYNSNVIGPHGGLHCELPNGTTVHMHDVIDLRGRR